MKPLVKSVKAFNDIDIYPHDKVDGHWPRLPKIIKRNMKRAAKQASWIALMKETK